MSSEIASREFEAYRKDDAEARAILDTAAAETRGTTPEEDERFDKLLTSAKAHQKRSEEFAVMAKKGADVDAMIRARMDEKPDPEADRRIESQNAALIANMRAVVEAHNRGNEIGEITTEYALPSQAELVRALSDFATGSSVYVNDFRATVAVYMRTMSPWISTATIMNGTDGRPIVLPVISADPTAYSPGEGTAITAADPTIGSALATPISYKALAYISQELNEDEQVGLLPYIAQTQGRSLALMAGSAYTASVLAAATNAGTATGVGGGGGTSGTVLATFMGYEDLLTLKYSAAAPYRMVGKWFMSNSMIQKARKYKDGLGNYLWVPAVALGQPDTFDGQAVYEDPYLASVASASKSVVYGDPGALIIKQLPLRVATSDQFVFNLDQIAIKTVYRGGAGLPDAAALRYLVAANS